MQDVVLHAQKREKTGKSFRSDAHDLVPGVVYGADQEPISLQIEKNVFDKVYKEVGGSKVIDLVIDESKKPIKVLIHEVQSDPVKNSTAHFDLYAVTLGEKMRTEVPIHFDGSVQAAESGAAVIVTIRDTVEVEANPLDLPENIPVSLEVLQEIGDSISVADLHVGQKVEITTEPTELVVKLDAPKEEEIEEEPADEESEEQESGDAEGAEEPEGSSDESSDKSEN